MRGAGCSLGAAVPSHAEADAAGIKVLDFAEVKRWATDKASSEMLARDYRRVALSSYSRAERRPASGRHDTPGDGKSDGLTLAKRRRIYTNEAIDTCCRVRRRALRPWPA